MAEESARADSIRWARGSMGLVRHFHFVAGQGGGDFEGPGIDAAAEGFDLGEPVSGEVGCAVEAAFAPVIDEDNLSVAGPGLKDFLKEGLAEALASGEVNGVEFLFGA